ncbi:MAG: hypothetical protein ACLFVL_00780 [Candidatus Aenigmatarchaeota archaeon]
MLDRAEKIKVGEKMMKKKKILGVVVISLLIFSLFSVVISPALALQEDEIYPTDDEGNRRDEFLVDHNINFDIFADSNIEYRVRLIDENEDIQDQVYVTTDGDGRYISSDYPQTFLQHDGVGEYYLELYDTEAEEVVATRDIIVYEEQDFTVGSTVETTDAEGESKEYFNENEWVYFEARIRDQYGWPPEQDIQPEGVNVYVQKEGASSQRIGQYQVDEDGNVQDSFRAWELDGLGDYTIEVYDFQDEELYASDTFTIVGINIDIENEYTQGQEMEIRIESNFGDPVDIRIQNSTEEPYRVMDDAEWADQEFENQIWTEEYTIPEDEPDGTYYVVVYSTDGELLEDQAFELKKYLLDATTDKAAYIPQETVEVHYTVERLIDGSQAENMDVEYRITYYDEDYNERVEKESVSYTGHFDFEVPSDILVPGSLRIDLWANGTQQEHSTHWRRDINVGELQVSFGTDSGEYIPGQKIYVTAQTSVSDSPVEEAEVTVILKHEGEVVEGYESTGRTDDRGDVVIPIHLSEDISGGFYHVNVSAEKHDMEAYAPEQEIQIKEEISRLDVILDRNKHSYSPGEDVEVSYTVTQQGEVVNANVKYEVFKGEPGMVQKVYERDYATGGTITFTVPENFDQDDTLYVRVDAKMDQEATGSDYMEIPVLDIDLLLNADQTEYKGGETIDFDYEVIGANVTRSEMYKIIDAQGDIIETAEPIEEGEFTFEVPEEPTSSYEVRLEVVSNEGILVRESLTLRRVSRYQLEISLESRSRYTTGVYEPGEEIEVHYKLRPVGDAKLPEKITIHYYFQATGESGRIQTDSPEGTFTIEAPDTTDGTYFMHVESYGGTFNTEPIEVEENPSVMSLRIVGGLSLLGLIGIILLLLLIGAVFYVAYYGEPGKPGFGLPGLFKGKGKKKQKEEKGPPTGPQTRETEETNSPAEKEHGWKGPGEGSAGEEDQIEPDRPE